MNTIYKFPLPKGRNYIYLPLDAKVLHIGEQANVVTMWALVKTTEPYVRRSFQVTTTGSFVDINQWKYLGTALTLGGVYVSHVFEVYNEDEPELKVEV